MTRSLALSVMVILAMNTVVSGAELLVPSAHPTIAAALGAAGPGDHVVIAPGTYLEHDLILPSGVVLRGESGDPADVVIDGERLGRCIYGAGLDASTRIEAVTLSNGLPAWGSTPYNSWGAGLMVDGGSLTVSHCIFRENETAIGGGAFVKGTGSPVFEDCLFEANQATEVAGLQLSVIGDPVVRNCVFRGGWRTMVGGGVTWSGSGTALLEGLIVEDNTVWETGGGIELLGYYAYAVLRDCVIRNNTADIGAAGLYVYRSRNVVLENVTITGNTGGEYAGGVEFGSYAIVRAESCTILNNTAPSGPDGRLSSLAAMTFNCCEVDPTRWVLDGQATFTWDGCEVGDEAVSWGDLKATFR
ncbi:right-handed parallel beta-helix repeat-containing protein [bacterium]|nr:right-handed parallel beta-helix repeat-containing protein [bacterium]